MDDVPWIYVVMIFIAFVSWVSNRIKEAAEYRRQMRAQRAAAERARRTTEEPEYESPYRHQRQPEPEPEPEPVQSYEEIFQELERRMGYEPDPEPAQRKTPPPLPGSSPEPSGPPVGSMPEMPDKPLAPSAPLTVQKRKKRKKEPAEVSSALTGVLRDGNQLRNALILKEVLDKPVSMRHR